VLEKQRIALQARLQGATYDAIARIDYHGAPLYANRQNAQKAVLAALSSQVADTVDQLRSVQAARYERLVRAMWAQALNLDPMALTQLRRYMADYNRLMGLNAPTRIEVSDEIDREIALLASQLGDDGTYDITGVPMDDEPVEEEVT
jgi:hypothetical protein